MNIKKIKYYIDLVECKNFTETAKKNFVSQTTISQQIAALENEFNIQLIDRKQIPIEPTKAGWLFYAEAMVLWKQYLHMQSKMENFQKYNTPTLSIEYAAMTDIQSLLKLIPVFKQDHPNMKLDLHKVLLKDVAQYLQKGIYDVAIAFDSEFKGKEDIATYSLYSGNYYAAVSIHHPLFSQSLISKEQLYQHPLIMLNPAVIGDSYSLMIQNAIEDGYQPQIVRTADDVETELFYIITENLIGFFPEHYDLAELKEEISLIPIQASHHTFRIEAGYLKDNENPALQLFLHKLKSTFNS